MAYLKTNYHENGNFESPVKVFACDITGDEIQENNGWYGNDKVHISEQGLNELIEQWIIRNNNGIQAPMFVKYLQDRFTKRLRPDRYIPLKTKKLVLLKYQNKCTTCGTTNKLEIDHIKPISKGGLHEISNLQVLCKPCNLLKSNKF